jgi:hypothetical protein
MKNKCVCVCVYGVRAYGCMSIRAYGCMYTWVCVKHGGMDGCVQWYV